MLFREPGAFSAVLSNTGLNFSKCDFMKKRTLHRKTYYTAGLLLVLIALALPAPAQPGFSRTLVKEIKIKGAYPLFGSDILKVMTLAPGDGFKEKYLPEQEKWIREFLNSQGYASLHPLISQP